MSSQWTVVLRGDWYLPHLSNMLAAYSGNGEQNECRDEMLQQLREQILPVGDDGGSMGTRPLLVIDPEDREQVEQVIAAYCRQFDHVAPEPEEVAHMQAALRSLARPEGPEPTGLGAVVRDGDGAEWVSIQAGCYSRPWLRRGANGTPLVRYSDLPRPLTVLSEGWSE